MFDLQLNQRPANISVYHWCVKKAQENEKKYLNALLQYIGSNKREFQSAKRLFKNKHLNESTKKWKEKIISEGKIKNQNFSCFISKEINAVLDDQATKNIVGIRSAKQLKNKIIINTENAGDIEILNGCNLKTSPFALFLKTIIMDTNMIKQSRSFDFRSEIKNQIRFRLATIICEHSIDSHAIKLLNNQRKKIDKKDLNLLLNKLSQAQIITALTVSIFNNVNHAKEHQEAQKRKKDRLRQAFRDNKTQEKHDQITMYITLFETIIPAMEYEKNLVNLSKKNDEKIQNYLEKAEKAQSQKNYKDMYNYLLCIYHNMAQKEERFASQCYNICLYNLAMAFIDGSGLEKPNYKKSVQFLEQVANQFYNHEFRFYAQSALVSIYLQGRPDIKQDIKKAEKLLVSLAQQNYLKELKAKNTFELAHFLRKSGNKDGFLELMKKAANQNACKKTKEQAIAILSRYANHTNTENSIAQNVTPSNVAFPHNQAQNNRAYTRQQARNHTNTTPSRAPQQNQSITLLRLPLKALGLTFQQNYTPVTGYQTAFMQQPMRNHQPMQRQQQYTMAKKIDF